MFGLHVLTEFKPVDYLFQTFCFLFSCIGISSGFFNVSNEAS